MVHHRLLEAIHFFIANNGFDSPIAHTWFVTSSLENARAADADAKALDSQEGCNHVEARRRRCPAHRVADWCAVLVLILCASVVSLGAAPCVAQLFFGALLLHATTTAAPKTRSKSPAPRQENTVNSGLSQEAWQELQVLIGLVVRARIAGCQRPASACT